MNTCNLDNILSWAPKVSLFLFRKNAILTNLSSIYQLKCLETRQWKFSIKLVNWVVFSLGTMNEICRIQSRLVFPIKALRQQCPRTLKSSMLAWTTTRCYILQNAQRQLRWGRRRTGRFCILTGCTFSSSRIQVLCSKHNSGIHIIDREAFSGSVMELGKINFWNKFEK